MRPLSNKTNLSNTGSNNAGDTQLHRLEHVREVWTPAGIVQPSIEGERVFQTPLGVLYKGDCARLLPAVIDESIDTIFADPPFNLAKKYGMKVDDARPDNEYVQWSKQWLDKCIRVLKPRGSPCSFCRPVQSPVLDHDVFKRLCPKLLLHTIFFPVLAPELTAPKQRQQNKSHMMAVYPHIEQG